MSRSALHILVPAELLEAIDAEAAKSMHSRSEVIAAIVGRFLADPQRRPLFPGEEFDLRKLTPAHRAGLLDRERIVLLWHKATVRKGGKHRLDLTESFLANLRLQEGRELCHGTLYNWLRRYTNAGRAGLVDGRWKNDFLAPFEGASTNDRKPASSAANGRIDKHGPDGSDCRDPGRASIPGCGARPRKSAVPRKAGSVFCGRRNARRPGR